MKKIHSIILLILFLTPSCGRLYAQDGSEEKTSLRPKLKFEARLDYNHDSANDDMSGIKGYIVDLKLEGDLSPRFSYKYRQRLNKPVKDASFFDATDWLYLTYKAHRNISLMAGKWIVAVGGWETEPAPIDIYQISEFCNNYSCYQWGMNVIFNTADNQNQFYLQVCESPFRKQYKAATGNGREMWAYNALWIGNIDFYHAFHSVNMMEYRPGKYLNFIALGNRFDLGRKVALDFDIQHRASRASDFFKDYTLSAQIAYRPLSAFRCFAKLSHDRNHTGNVSDVTVFDGTKMTRLGGGVEFFPLKNDNLRLHGHYSYAWGQNANPDGVLRDGQSVVNVGLTWRMHILK